MAVAPDRPAHRSPALLAAIGCGGAVGTAARAWLESIAPAAPGDWPWTTWVINLAGATVLGALLGYLGSLGPDGGRRRAIRLALGTGLLGGFTTYSAFAVEAALLVRDGHVTTAALYAVGSVSIGAVLALVALVAVRARRAR